VTADRFPSTRRSVVAALAGGDERVREDAWEALARAYWRPVHAYLCRRWRADPDDAQDLAQEFFSRAQARQFFAAYDPGRARFRTFLRVCLDRFVMREREAASRQKRGGGVRVLSLHQDSGALPAPDPADPDADPEAQFQREWVRALFAEAVEHLRARSASRGRSTAFEIFVAYDLEGSDAPDRPSYDALARRHNIPVTQVTNHLSAMRRDFRREVLARLRALTGSEAEFRAEARELLGWEAG
jgi:DNA-directed RNA polymerase specialized sigma24 family protein